jgi:hypothetical protein
MYGPCPSPSFSPPAKSRIPDSYELRTVPKTFLFVCAYFVRAGDDEEQEEGGDGPGCRLDRHPHQVHPGAAGPTPPDTRQSRSCKGTVPRDRIYLLGYE